MSGTTKVAKSHSHCQNCLQVSRLQSLLCKTVYKAAEAARQARVGDRKASSPRLNAKRVYNACALNQSLQNRLQGKIPQRLIFV